MHCHATNLIALSYVLDLSSAAFTRALWEMSTECLVVFPEGIGVLPWKVPGTPTIGEATAIAMKKHPLVLWPFHGIFGSGTSLDETFGLIDTAEKAAEVLVKVLSMGGKKQSITTQQLKDLAARFDVKPMPEALAIEKWIS
jgi:rhamnulose-1-phosphate aldolase